MSGLITSLLENSIRLREPLLDAPHRAALRLFNGFNEGCPHLVVDLYARTALFHNYAPDPGQGLPLVREAQAFLQERLPWLRAGIVKIRNSPVEKEKRGFLLFGDAPDRKIQEHGVWYALDLCLYRDAGFYLDTRNLRQWLIRHAGGKTFLNTFACTGSLGVAACAGGATRVFQLDLNRTFLNIAKTSCTLNGFPVHREDFIAGDFWSQVSRLRRAGVGFDCVLVDPPFFSATARGALDLNTDSARLVNKVRPLVNDGGWLVAINNALYVSGKEYMDALQALCLDGYLNIAELIPVPQDFIGVAGTDSLPPITDPAPFNHATKIAILEVRRKKG
jgi:23S rRNA (cytosine1962-C5)-methyltransferase